MNTPNIYLIGYRCTGKTTLGQALALRLTREFVDMDDRLVAETGRSISEMVNDKGWPFFRSRERDLLGRLAATKNTVVGTGGGIVLDPQNSATMRASGRVVWLRSQSRTILRRMQADPRTRLMRPALTDLEQREEIETTLQERDPLYRAAAHIVIDTDALNITNLCAQLIDMLNQPDAGGGGTFYSSGAIRE